MDGSSRWKFLPRFSTSLEFDLELDTKREISASRGKEGEALSGRGGDEDAAS
jgi:hypothetical protein